jgi:patched 1
MSLRMYLIMALGCAISAALVLVGILLLSVWAAVLVVLSVLTMLIQLLGIMVLLEIKLSAIPAVILVASVGIGVCFSVHITLVGSNNATFYQIFTNLT